MRKLTYNELLGCVEGCGVSVGASNISWSDSYAVVSRRSIHVPMNGVRNARLTVLHELSHVLIGEESTLSMLQSILGETNEDEINNEYMAWTLAMLLAKDCGYVIDRRAERLITRCLRCHEKLRRIAG